MHSKSAPPPHVSVPQASAMFPPQIAPAGWSIGSGLAPGPGLVATLELILAENGVPKQVRSRVAQAVREHAGQDGRCEPGPARSLQVDIGGKIIAIKWRKQAGVWVFTSDDVPGLFVGHPDAGEALASVERAVQRLRDAGKPPPPPNPMAAQRQPQFKRGDRVVARNDTYRRVATVMDVGPGGFKWRLDNPVCFHPLIGSYENGECFDPGRYRLAVEADFLAEAETQRTGGTRES